MKIVRDKSSFCAVLLFGGGEPCGFDEGLLRASGKTYLGISDDDYEIIEGVMPPVHWVPSAFSFEGDEWSIFDQALYDDALRELIQIRALEINEERERRLEKADVVVSVDGVQFQAARKNINDINEALTLYTALGEAPQGGVWLDVDNNEHPRTIDLLAKIGAARGEYNDSVWMASWAIKRVLRSCTTFAELQSVDMSGGWPTA